MGLLRLVLDGVVCREFGEALPWPAGLRFSVRFLRDQLIVMALLNHAKLANGTVERARNVRQIGFAPSSLLARYPLCPLNEPASWLLSAVRAASRRRQAVRRTRVANRPGRNT